MNAAGYPTTAAGLAKLYRARLAAERALVAARGTAGEHRAAAQLRTARQAFDAANI